MRPTRPPVARPAACTRCGAPVLAFTVDTQNWPVQLDPDELPITADLPALVAEGRVWRDLGPRIGWDPLCVAIRDWRPLRALHQCATTEHEHEKEKHA